MGQGIMRVAGQTAGWFADPAGRFRFRYWDGGQWTDQVLSGTTREESLDPLEAELRVQPPRPVLPNAPVESSGEGAPLVDPAPRAVTSGERTFRVPRPTPAFFAAVLLVALVVGVTIWLLGELAGNDSNHPVSVQSLVSGSNAGTTYPAIQNLGSPDAAGVHFTADPALPGDRRAQLSGLGISMAIPQTWYAVNGGSAVVQRAAQQNGVTADGLVALAKVRLFAVDRARPTVALVVQKLKGDSSILGQSEELKKAIEQSVPNIVPGGVAVTRTKVAGMGALHLVATVLVRGVDGSGQVLVLNSYFVVTPHGVADISTVSRSDDPGAGAVIDSLVAHVKKAG
jgi:hypothetical protein